MILKKPWEIFSSSNFNLPFIFGYFKSKITGVPVISGALKVMLIGALAAGAAYSVALLFK